MCRANLPLQTPNPIADLLAVSALAIGPFHFVIQEARGGISANCTEREVGVNPKPHKNREEDHTLKTLNLTDEQKPPQTSVPIPIILLENSIRQSFVF